MAELERCIANWKIEVQRLRAEGMEDDLDPQKLAKIEMWEKEFKGLRSLRDERRPKEK